VSKRDDELMQYLDGELNPREAREVEDQLAESPEARAKVEAIQELGDVMRDWVDGATREAEPQLAAMWARIEGQLGDPEAAPTADRKQARPSLWARISEWFGEGYRGYAFTGAACAAAAALLMFVAVHGKTKVVVEQGPERVVIKVEHDAQQPQPVIEAKASPAEIEKLDVAEGTGTVFKIPAAQDGDADTTVIWVVRDEPSQAEGPI
jgi:anti-sigma factor RsiW